MTDRQTHTHTDRQTDRQTDNRRISIFSHLLFSSLQLLPLFHLFQYLPAATPLSLSPLSPSPLSSTSCVIFLSYLSSPLLQLHAKEIGPKLPDLLSLRTLSDAEASTIRCASTRAAAVAAGVTSGGGGATAAGATSAPGTGASGLQAVPTSMRQVMECGAELTPAELHKVVVGPPIVDFGKVCLRSNAVKVGNQDVSGVGH